MDDSILLCFEKSLILFLSAVVYVYLVGRVFPYLTMHLTVRLPERGMYPEGDRGIRRVKFPDGRAVIYEPIPEIRRFMPEYALIKREGVTLIKCRIHENIRHIRYDVAAYDARGRLLDVLGVRELITERGYTRSVRLPRNTAYVRMILRKADGMYEERRKTVGYKFAGMGILWALTMLSTLVTGVLIYDSLTVLTELLLYREIMPFGSYVLLTLAMGVLSGFWIMWMYSLQRKKVLNR